MDTRLPLGLLVGTLTVVSFGCGTHAASSGDGAAPPADTTGTKPFGANIGPVTTCDVTKPFGPATMIDGLVMEDDSFTFSADYLTIYFATGRAPGATNFDIMRATRPSLTAPFGELFHVPISSGGGDRYPVLSHDGLRLFETYEDSEVRMATRKSVTAEFDTFGVLEGLFEFQGRRPWFSSDEKLVYFDQGHIFVADYAKDTATATNMRLLISVNSSMEDVGPVLTADGLTMYFSSNRSNGRDVSGFRIWMAKRANATDAFGDPALITELVPAIHDRVFWVSPEGCTIYFTRIGVNADHYPMMAVRGR